MCLKESKWKAVDWVNLTQYRNKRGETAKKKSNGILGLQKFREIYLVHELVASEEGQDLCSKLFYTIKQSQNKHTTLTDT